MALSTSSSKLFSRWSVLANSCVDDGVYVRRAVELRDSRSCEVKDIGSGTETRAKEITISRSSNLLGPKKELCDCFSHVHATFGFVVVFNCVIVSSREVLWTGESQFIKDLTVLTTTRPRTSTIFGSILSPICVQSWNLL